MARRGWHLPDPSASGVTIRFGGGAPETSLIMAGEELLAAITLTGAFVPARTVWRPFGIREEAERVMEARVAPRHIADSMAGGRAGRDASSAAWRLGREGGAASSARRTGAPGLSACPTKRPRNADTARAHTSETRGEVKR